MWKVFETAEAIFEVDDYEHYVKVQSEAALRNLATSYAYDAHDDAQVSLRGHTAAVAEHLKREIHDRLVKAGVEVIEARLSHLAYAPEIAQAMLQRQQAGAIIAARQRIVEGAVGMVEMALDMLSKKSIVQLDEERKAAMVSNLLVVLCGDRSTQPVINTGTILPIIQWLIANRSCFGSIQRCWRPSSVGRTTICAASTGRSSSSCAGRCSRRGAMRRRNPGRRRNPDAAARRS